MEKQHGHEEYEFMIALFIDRFNGRPPRNGTYYSVLSTVIFSFAVCYSGDM